MAEYNEAMATVESYIMATANLKGVVSDVELNKLIDELSSLFINTPPFNLTPLQYEDVADLVRTKYPVSVVPGAIISYQHKLLLESSIDFHLCAC